MLEKGNIFGDSPNRIQTPSFIRLECSYCNGEGYLLSFGQPGEFSSADLAFLPSESFSACPNCDGEGCVEVCAECLSPLVVHRGEEVCACSKLQTLPHAA